MPLCFYIMHSITNCVRLAIQAPLQMSEASFDRLQDDSRYFLHHEAAAYSLYSKPPKILLPHQYSIQPDADDNSHL